MNKSLPVTLLKPAACLLVGASAVFGCSAANALTFNWSFINTNGTPNATGTTSGTITGLTEGVNNISPGLSPPGLSAILTSSTSGNGLPVPETWLGGTGTITVTSGAVSNYNFTFSNTISEFRGDNTNGIAYVKRFSTNNNDLTFGSNPITFSSASAAAVPGPLPILGLPAAFLSTRKLRRRIKASKNVASTSLD